MRLDDSLKLAGQLLAAHMQTTAVPEDRIAAVLHALHKDVLRIQSGSYAAWQDELPPLDVLDQAEIERITPRSYPPPQHPLAAPEVAIEDKIAGTVHHDRVECLECGKGVTLLKSHLLTSHQRMSWAEYLDRHGLPEAYPATSLDHAAKQSASQKSHWASKAKGREGAGDAATTTPEGDDQEKYGLVSPAFGRGAGRDGVDVDGALGRTG